MRKMAFHGLGWGSRNINLANTTCQLHVEMQKTHVDQVSTAAEQFQVRRGSKEPQEA